MAGRGTARVSWPYRPPIDNVCYPGRYPGLSPFRTFGARNRSARYLLALADLYFGHENGVFFVNLMAVGRCHWDVELFRLRRAGVWPISINGPQDRVVILKARRHNSPNGPKDRYAFLKVTATNGRWQTPARQRCNNSPAKGSAPLPLS